MTGKIKPNQRITEKEVAEEFGISTTPVREAIKRLSGEGLISIDSHKEAFVRELSYKELMNIYEAMVCIDERCIELAFTGKKPAFLKEMEEGLAAMEDYVRKGKVEKYLEYNEQMHLKIAELSGNEFLFQIRELIYAQLSRYRPLRLFLFSHSDAVVKYIKTNKALLEALKAGDSKRIEEIEPEDWIHYLPSEKEWLAYQENR
ncbi:MAG: GntR family transcriptional regulator [Candidatus Aminicenantes bacterium]|nr:GntR family transcriptional regulator [Candidatus Aminicenantes bacterium]